MVSRGLAMNLRMKTIVLFCFLLVNCSFPVMSYCSEGSGASKKVVTAETLWLLGYFARDNFPFVGDAVSDRVPAIALNLSSSNLYFLDTGPGVHPLTVGSTAITAYDLTRLSVDLSEYSTRIFKKADFDYGQEALTASCDLMALPLSLTPPKLITLSREPEIKKLGVYSYSYTFIPLSTGIKAMQDALQTIDPSSTGSFKEAKKRVELIRNEVRALSKKAVAFFGRPKWGIGIEETDDTRAYAKLFQDELPILRQQLTLLKSDIDKGFAELQKQQDAKTQIDKTATTDKAATTK